MMIIMIGCMAEEMDTAAKKIQKVFKGRHVKKKAPPATPSLWIRWPGKGEPQEGSAQKLVFKRLVGDLLCSNFVQVSKTGDCTKGHEKGTEK